MKLKILLVNPPIYDFAAYDFWLKPYGLLAVAGFLRRGAQFTLFDFLDRANLSPAGREELRSDQWGRGRFLSEHIPRPKCLEQIPRHFARFGLPRDSFRRFLKDTSGFDFALVQTTMTYWYPGVREVMEDIRTLSPRTKIVVGGTYVTLCPTHAHSLEADVLIQAANIEPLWDYLQIAPDTGEPPLWQAYEKLDVGVLKLSDGCPFNCTYCSVPKFYGKFRPRPLAAGRAEMALLYELSASNIAFYDDALLFQSDEVLMPFLDEVLSRRIDVNFHCPNGLNARFITGEIARLMVRAGFKTFYLGFESASAQFQQRTGAKVYRDELAQAVARLTAAGARPSSITAYQLLGHPDADLQQLEESMHFVHSLGIRGMLSDFSPIPGTLDGDRCKKWIDMDEPLMHNKTAFPIITLGFEETNRLKDLQRKLNRALAPA